MKIKRLNLKFKLYKVKPVYQEQTSATNSLESII
jgi:hypothetical protein